MIPLLLDLELSPEIKAQALVSAIGWVDLERSLTITLAPSSLAAGTICLVLSADMADEAIGELVDEQNDRVALVTNIRGVAIGLDRLLSQSLDRFVESVAPEPLPPALPPLPVVCTR